MNPQAAEKLPAGSGVIGKSLRIWFGKGNIRTIGKILSVRRDLSLHLSDSECIGNPCVIQIKSILCNIVIGINEPLALIFGTQTNGEMMS